MNRELKFILLENTPSPKSNVIVRFSGDPDQHRSRDFVRKALP
jgi:hypothetical protein